MLSREPVEPFEKITVNELDWEPLTTHGRGFGAVRETKSGTCQPVLCFIVTVLACHRRSIIAMATDYNECAVYGRTQA